MKIFVNLADNSLVDNLSRVYSAFVMKRGNTSNIDLVFLDENTGLPSELSGTAVIEFGLSALDVFGGAQLVYSASFTKNGTGVNCFYRGSPSFNTENMQTALTGKGQITANMEISVTISGAVFFSQYVQVLVQNSVLLAGSPPTPSSPPYPSAPTDDTALVGFGGVWYKMPFAHLAAIFSRGFSSVSGDGANSLDSLPTANAALTPLRSIRRVVTGTAAGGDCATQEWTLYAGTNATGAMHQRPLDYASGTNEKVWVRTL